MNMRDIFGISLVDHNKWSYQGKLDTGVFQRLEINVAAHPHSHRNLSLCSGESSVDNIADFNIAINVVSNIVRDCNICGLKFIAKQGFV